MEHSRYQPEAPARDSAGPRWRFGLVCLVLVLAGCTQMPDPWIKAGPQQKRVLVSFPPIYSLTKAIAGDDAFVMCLLSTKGPHTYQESPSDMVKLKRADLVLVNGLGLDEAFMQKLFNGSGNLKGKLIKLGDELADKDLLPGEKHGDHDHGDYDPHIWLGPPEARQLIKLIAEKLAAVDETHAMGYRKRAVVLDLELQKLQQEGLELLKDKKNRKILSMHESLGYFARAFDIQIAGSIQQQAGIDPDAVRLGKLADNCKELDVRLIAVEPQYNPALAKALQKQLQARGIESRLVEIDPLETAVSGEDGQPDPQSYFKGMRKNLENLAKALP